MRDRFRKKWSGQNQPQRDLCPTAVDLTLKITPYSLIKSTASLYFMPYSIRAMATNTGALDEGERGG